MPKAISFGSKPLVEIEIDFFYDAVQLNNASIIAVGETNSSNGDLTENKGFSDALIIKTN